MPDFKPSLPFSSSRFQLPARRRKVRPGAFFTYEGVAAATSFSPPPPFPADADRGTALRAGLFYGWSPGPGPLSSLSCQSGLMGDSKIPHTTLRIFPFPPARARSKGDWYDHDEAALSSSEKGVAEDELTALCLFFPLPREKRGRTGSRGGRFSAFLFFMFAPRSKTSGIKKDTLFFYLSGDGDNDGADRSS